MGRCDLDEVRALAGVDAESCHLPEGVVELGGHRHDGEHRAHPDERLVGRSRAEHGCGVSRVTQVAPDRATGGAIGDAGEKAVEHERAPGGRGVRGVELFAAG